VSVLETIPSVTRIQCSCLSGKQIQIGRFESEHNMDMDASLPHCVMRTESAAKLTKVPRFTGACPQWPKISYPADHAGFPRRLKRGSRQTWPKVRGDLLAGGKPRRSRAFLGRRRVT